MHRKFLFVSVLALLVIMVALGCGKNSTSPKKTNQNIEFSKTEISFEVGHLQEDVVLTNQSDQSLSWNVSEVPAWIVVDKQGGDIRASRTDTLHVAAATTDLAEGNYQGTIHIEWNGGEIDIPVLLVQQAGKIDVNFPILNFDRNVWNGNLIILNKGTESFAWTISGNPDWIEVDKDSGMVFDVPDTVSIRINYGGMDYGEYTDSLMVVSSVGNVTVTVHFLMERLREIIPGYAVGKIRVGLDTYKKILDTYGEHDWRAYDDNDFTHSIGYSWVGLQFDFYSEQLVLYDNTPCTGIVMEPPYDGLTEMEIGIGSTRAEVIAAYEDPQIIENGEEIYDIGVAFTYESGVVKTIRIFRP